MHVALEQPFGLRFCRCNQGLHLVLEEGRRPLMCRKTPISELRRLLTNEVDRAFNGRLQLHRCGDTIRVMANDRPVGTIPVATLEAVLDATAAKNLPTTE